MPSATASTPISVREAMLARANDFDSIYAAGGEMIFRGGKFYSRIPQDDRAIVVRQAPAWARPRKAAAPAVIAPPQSTARIEAARRPEPERPRPASPIPLTAISGVANTVGLVVQPSHPDGSLAPRSMFLPDSYELASTVDLLIDHDRGQRLGSTADGMLRVVVRPRGLFMCAYLPDAPLGRRTLERIKRHRLHSLSIGFVTLESRLAHDVLGSPFEKITRALVEEVSLCEEGADITTYIVLTEFASERDEHQSRFIRLPDGTRAYAPHLTGWRPEDLLG